MASPSSPPRRAEPTPPGPFLQWLNALFHREPFSTLFYLVIWSVYFFVACPLGFLILWTTSLIKLGRWLIGLSGEGHFQPSKQADLNMAVVITGCDSGFGRECALRAGQQGFTVFAGCLHEASFEQYKHDDNVRPVKMNIMSDEEVRAVAKQVADWLANADEKGRLRVLHALYNNAGDGVLGEIDWIPMSGFQFVMDLNFLGMVRVTKAFIPLLQRQALQRDRRIQPRILNMVSAAGMIPIGALHVAYTCSKMAAHGFSINLRAEMAHLGVQVTTINPSFHETAIMTSHEDKMRKTWNAISDEQRTFYGKGEID